jgi:virginiamycin B lyase
MIKPTLLFTLALAVTFPSSAEAQAPVTLTITEWEVPWANTRPRDPYVAPDGSVWFVGQTGHYVARFDPRSAEFKRFALDDGAGPHNLIVDQSGTIWYAGNRQAHIGKVNPASGAIQKFAMADAGLRDPHTLVFDKSGNIWFTAQGGGHIGRLNMRSGEVRMATVPTERARPYGIVIDARGRPWFNEMGSNKIGVVDPATLAVREFTLPNERSRTRRIAATSDGGIWYVDYTRGFIGRLDPESGNVEEYAAPSAATSLPYALTVDDRDRLWFVETGIRPNQFVGFDTKSRRFIGTTPIKSGGGAVRHMVYDARTKSIWFGTDAGTLGRAVVPD